MIVKSIRNSNIGMGELGNFLIGALIIQRVRLPGSSYIYIYIYSYKIFVEYKQMF